MAHDVTWVVVADAAGARIFVHGDPEAPGLKLLKTLEHPESRAKVSELVTDKPGRVQQSADPSLKPAAMTEHDAKETEERRFAAELGEEISKAHTLGRFRRLVLVAEPKFLGLLRKQIPDPVLKTVVQAIPKDWVHVPEDEIEERLASEGVQLGG